MPDETDRFTYDDLGNLTSKSDYATSYQYGTSSRAIGKAGPHAVRQASGGAGGTLAFSYDENGSLVRQVATNPAAAAGGTTAFAYGPGGGRYRQRVMGGTGTGYGPKTVYYLDKDYEVTVWEPGSAGAWMVEARTFIGSSVVVVSTLSAGNTVSR